MINEMLRCIKTDPGTELRISEVGELINELLNKPHEMIS